MMCPYCGEGAVEIKLKLICTSAICGYRILETCCEAEPTSLRDSEEALAQ